MRPSLKCSHCGTRMTAIENRGVTIDWCEFCQGLWFDPTELVATITNGQTRPRGPDPFERKLPPRGQSALSCPRCRPQALVAVGWVGLSFTQCPKCFGVFLDRPQLAAVRARYRRGPRPITSAEIGGELTMSVRGLARWAELLWTLARMVARLKLGPAV
jgi:Zn-finger nucleic acid-binding protein